MVGAPFNVPVGAPPGQCPELLRKAQGSNTYDIARMLTGMDITGLKQAGAKNYPQTPPGSQHHQEAMRIIGERYGFIPSQVIGLMVEGLQHAPAISGKAVPKKEDTVSDFISNLAGGLEGQAKAKANAPVMPAGTETQFGMSAGKTPAPNLIANFIQWMQQFRDRGPGARTPASAGGSFIRG